MSLVEIYYIYLQTFRKGLKPRANTWNYLDEFQIPCGALDLHMQRSDTSNIISKLFLTVRLYQKNKVSINCFKGQSEHKESFSTWKKCSVEQKFLRTPRASQDGGSDYSLGSKLFTPLGMSLVILCLIHLCWVLGPTGASPFLFPDIYLQAGLI